MSEEILQKMEEIRGWIKDNSNFEKILDNNSYMRFGIELANKVRLVMLVTATLIPTENFPGYSREEATILGLFVRSYKLFDAMTFHASKGHDETAAIFFRLIFETHVRMKYLITNGQDSARSFIFVSFRPAKEQIQDLLRKQASRKLIKIEERMLANLRAQLKEAQIEEADLLKNRTWEIDGKNFRQILETLDLGDGYAYGFGAQSAVLHGDWKDIRAHHVTKKGDWFFPSLEHGSVDIRYICPLCIPCLDAIREFLDWNGADPDGYVHHIADELETLARGLDHHHETNAMGWGGPA